jgi:hypothetical protein
MVKHAKNYLPSVVRVPRRRGSGFHKSIFKDSKISNIARSGEAGRGTKGGKKVIAFLLDG